MTELLPVVVVLSENFKLHLILTHPSLPFLMQILLKKHKEAEAVDNKELFLLFAQLAFFLLLFLAHLLSPLIDLLDASLDFNQLLEFEVVLLHKLI